VAVVSGHISQKLATAALGRARPGHRRAWAWGRGRGRCCRSVPPTTMGGHTPLHG